MKLQRDADNVSGVTSRIQEMIQECEDVNKNCFLF
jgi:hypothetical protein